MPFEQLTRGLQASFEALNELAGCRSEPRSHVVSCITQRVQRAKAELDVGGLSLGSGPSPAPPTAPESGGAAAGIGVTHRYSRVRLRLNDLPATKSMRLPPYLWKFIQDVDATSKLGLTIEVDCPAGLGEDVLRDKIQQSFEMLGLSVNWEV